MKKYIIATCLLFIFIYNYSQDKLHKVIPELTVASPETAGLGRYGEIPMNLYTGTANISVPLYNLDFDGLEIPINLSYNTSGIRVSQEASWVGLGWILSCEPVVTRQINGHCDITKGMGVNKSIFGYAYTDVTLPSYGGGIIDLNSDFFKKLEFYYDYRLEMSGWDTEPDIFTANIFGESVSFILTQKALTNGKISVKLINGDTRYKVEYVENDKSFILINDRGFKFFFGQKEYSLAAPKGPQGYNATLFTNKLITGWKLNQIISPKGNILSFSYAGATMQSQPQNTNKRMTTCYPSYGNIYNEMENDNYGMSSYIQGYKISYLESIRSNNIEIQFKGSERLDLHSDEPTNIWLFIPEAAHSITRKLDNVIIKNSKGDILSNYKFTYSYFNQNLIGSNEQYIKRKIRLKLDKIEKDDNYYRSFTYINENQLPDKTIRMDDFWGYYNGDNHHHRSFPSYSNSVTWLGKTRIISVTGGNRRANLEFSKNGILETITYPTKGYTQINYELNDIKVDLSNIKDFEPYDLPIHKECILESSSVDYPKESEIFEITEDVNIESVFEIEFGPGGQYDITHEESHIKYSVEEKDKRNIAFQLIDIDNGDIIIDSRFTEGLSEKGSALKLIAGSNTWNKQRTTKKLPKGRYKAVAKALKHISNFYDKQDGAELFHPDYGKHYNFWVKVKIKIPYLAFSNNLNLEVGGLRIKSIDNYDESKNLLLKKEYKYILENKEGRESISSGKLIDGLNFVDFTVVSFGKGTDPDHEISSNNPVMTVYSDNISRAPTSNHIGYSRVEEIEIDNLNKENNGWQVTYFNNNSNIYGNFPSGNTLLFPNSLNMAENISLIPTHSFPEMNGKVLREEFYNKTNIKIKESTDQYHYNNHSMPNIAHSNSIGTGIKQYIRPFYSNFGSITQTHSLIYALQIYKVISENNSLISKTDVVYLNGMPVSKTTTYEYNNQFLPSNIKETTSVSDIKNEIEYKYPIDLVEIEQKDLMQKMVDDNIISEPVIIKTKIGSKQTAESHTKYKETPVTYKENNQEKSKGLIVLDEVHQLVGDGDINVETSNNNNRKIKYDSYNKQGNLLQYTGKDNNPITYLWSYSGQYPIAEIKNATYDQVKAYIDVDALSQKTEPTENDIRSILNLQNSLKDAMITTYTYKPLVGMTSMTDPSGVTTYYEYDDFGRLKESYYYENNDVNKRRVLQTYEYNYQNQ